MKKLLLLTLSLVLGASAFAQPMRKIGPMKADRSDIILTQPEGELRTYIRTGGCVDVVSSLFVHDLRQDGTFARVVFSDDGKTAYFQNIISRAATGAWVKGNIKGDSIEVPYGQLVYWFDNPVNQETGKPEAPYGLQLAGVTMKGAHTEYTATTKGSALFLIRGDSLVLANTSADLNEKNITGLGLTYTNQYDGEWSYYMDYETVYRQVDDVPVTPPEGVVTERYSLTHGIYGHFVDVAFARGNVYIKGVSDDYVPNAWIRGTLDEETNKIYFPRQVAGSYQVYMFYFIGADMEKVDDYYGGQYTYTFNPDSTGIVFDYDPQTRSFWTERGLVVNNAKDSLDRFERYPKATFRPYTEKAGTPSAPRILQIDDQFWAHGYKTSMMAMEVPVCDEEGNFMDPSKLAYRLYVDDDEPYNIYKDEYPNIPVDEIEEIPYYFTDNRYLYPKGNFMYIFQNGFERMGIQSIYYGGGERHETGIYYTVPNSLQDDGVEEIVNSKSSNGKLFDLSGRQMQHANLTKGLYIKNGKKYLIK